MGLLHLAENLRLADDQRVEAGGDAEEMPRGVEVRDVVHVRQQRRRIHAVKLADEVDEVSARALGLLARRVDFGAVARREHDGFARRSALGQRAQRRLDAARLEVEPLAQLDRRGAMADSNE